jgi:RNA polymerase sigma-70 factor (ECF subfamily)
MSVGLQFESVLIAAQSGAEWAVAVLYRDLHPAVLRYLHAQEPREAEDLESETWLDVARSLSRFRGQEADFRKWVFAIARRRLIDFRRQSSRRRTQPTASETLAERMPPGDAEEDAMEGFATEAALARIATLPHDQAEVVLLRVVAGFSAQEVARIMGKRPGTVRVLQHRALARLARDIAKEPVTP